MAVTVSVLNESNNRTSSISFDFVYDILASEKDFPLSTNYEFYFKALTSAKQDDGAGSADGDIPIYINMTDTDLVLAGAKQARSDTAVAYTSLTDLVEDYLFDIIHGHAADKFSSGVEEQGQMLI
jgi:hypothetical protein